MSNLFKLKEELFPFWSRVDTLVEKKLKQILAPGQYRYFDSCRKKLNSIWYIFKRISELDSKYVKLGEELLRSPEAELKQNVYLQPVGEHEYRFEAYWEASEIEHLFFQAKACADVFAKAVGSVFGKDLPKNVPKLIKILERVRAADKKDTAKRILIEIDDNKQYLRGIILPPEQLNKSQKSLRDISTHYERLNVYFRIRLPGGNGKAGVFGGFIDTRGVLLQNFKAINVSRNLWFGLNRMIERSFAILAKVSLRD